MKLEQCLRVKKGQLWQDLDPRYGGRIFKIVDVTFNPDNMKEQYADVVSDKGRRSRIALGSFERHHAQRGYKFLE